MTEEVQTVSQNTYNKTDKPKSKHNGIISMWKFLFSIMVILRHVESCNPYFANFKYTFIAGSIAVDFFFLVSGFLMAKKAISKIIDKENIGSETYDYIMKKIKSFLPYILIAVIASAVLYLIKGNILTASKTLNFIFDILMLPMILIRHSTLLGIEWYISAMLISMAILYPLILKHKKNFLYIAAPLIGVFALGFISRMDGHLAGPDIYYFGYLPKSLVRALAVMCLGCFIYVLVEKIKKIDFTLFARAILTIVEIVGFASIFIMVNIPDAHAKFDFVMILILFISTTIAFSEKTLLLKACSNKFVYYLEKISLPMYLNHMWIIELFHMALNGYKISYYLESLIVILITIVVSIILTYIINKISNSNKLKENIRKAFIKA